MIHEIFPVGPLQCNCSIIGDEASREATVIDPGDDIDQVLALIRKHNLQVKQIVITHAHIDHVGGAMKLRAATGAPILLNQNDYALLKMLDVQAAWIGVPHPGDVQIDQSVTTGEIISVGSIAATVLHTPGHTLESAYLRYDNLVRKEVPTYLTTSTSLTLSRARKNFMEAKSRKRVSMWRLLKTRCRRKPSPIAV